MDRISAAKQVFSTYELLEGVLKHAWPPDLRTSRYVCKQWHAVIARSKTLQKICQAKCLKVVLLRDEGVGKKSLANHSTVHSFPYHTNAGGIYRHLMIGEEPWDIILDPFAAEFRYYDALFQQTVQNNDLFVLVFNLTSRESFEWLDSWIRKVADIEQKLPRKGFLAIVGTHADLEHDRMVGIEEGRALAYRNKCGYVEISLSDHQGMDEFLERCVRMHVASRASTMAKSTLGKPLGAESRQSEISAEIMRDLVLERADCRFSVEDRGRLGFVARRKDEGVLAKVKRWFCGN